MKQIHGGDVYRHKNVIDFSANTNPFGPPEGVVKAAQKSIERMEHYPDVFCSELTEALSEYEMIPKEWLLCGNGAADLIFRVVQALQPKKALIQAPAFAEYEQALQSAKCEIQYYDTSIEQKFSVTEEILERITEDIDIIFLCNPNNPTGMLIEGALLERICERCKEQEVLFVLDECFLDFVAEGESLSMKPLLESNPYLFILRAFTKRYAMAGLRLGYSMTSNQELQESMRTIAQPWSVSTPAQAAGIAALKEEEYVKSTMAKIIPERVRLQDKMRLSGLQVFDSKANYIFFRGPKDLYENCLNRGILIRDCSNYRGLEKGYYRIAVRKPEENDIFLRTIQEIVGR
ncbi:MAG: threonine-phosphate decarboxylase CobD [Lachnospiraceae bacterium]|nr:threonine-phosphate decarboxylase CobD [Lachnospiraceae bacterium]MDD3615961.1 threonine-phosphate decarboxylase CobD [Lachnospiraceae bacterium]